MSIRGQHILSSEQFSLDVLNELFRISDLLVPVARGEKYTRILEGAVLGSLFFEASTRTRLSFDAAFLRLGGKVSHTTGVTFSSIVKGESLADTSRVIGGYVDMLVIRHPEESAVYDIAAATNIPVINGGNGAGEHPTQALLDIYTIRNEMARLGKSIDGRRVALVGDLRYGRTIHSLIRLLSLYRDLTLVLIAPPALELPEKYVDLAERRGHRIIRTSDLRQGLAGCDLVYTTRVQRERFPEGAEPVSYTSEFRINRQLVDACCPPDIVIMHPLPRDSRPEANDLSDDLDGDPRLAIFRQTDAGVPTRMALFAMVLGVEDRIEQSLQPARWWRPAKIGPKDTDFQRG